MLAAKRHRRHESQQRFRFRLHMQEGQRRVLIFVAATVVAVVGVWLVLWLQGSVPPPGVRAELFKMSDRLADLQVVETQDGTRFQFGDLQFDACGVCARASESETGREARLAFCNVKYYRNCRLVLGGHRPAGPGFVYGEDDCSVVGERERKAFRDSHCFLVDEPRRCHDADRLFRVAS